MLDTASAIVLVYSASYENGENRCGVKEEIKTLDKYKHNDPLSETGFRSKASGNWYEYDWVGKARAAIEAEPLEAAATVPVEYAPVSYAPVPRTTFLMDHFHRIFGRSDVITTLFVSVLACICFAALLSGHKRYTDPGPPPAEAVSAASAKGQILVWCNHYSMIYHFPENEWYGNTKNGEYLPEDEALKAGYRKAENEE